MYVRVRGRTKATASSDTACPIPASTASRYSWKKAWMCESGASLYADTTAGSTGTPSNTVVPDAVSRWPNPSQSSTLVTPGASTGTANVTRSPERSAAR
ncbi:hypothetical protein QP157_18750 [Sphingomonas sp. LR61]|uniref:hypothetical protein n=1 Tax=Sphingomonas sp. LR61 TaxID=3050234 RepID=UPI002FE00449